ncbi:type VI secretion system ImpA family N-terminal domain-containing protein [Sandarakinorhabdus sp.]|uniref:type VI secretion system protein TssA n=1 Tax=Sandarakinorhabdus sp. TaxID=1916663 RepID=UPI00286E2AB9|nr:type VI secretion system ImpA family N-terminal domain-containing protein [Sandarakinorhabdus sp.]
MSLVDIESLMAPVSADAPCGPDLRADPDFRDIEDAPGGFAGMKAPELSKVVRRCAEMLGKTKDQMPAIVAVQAAIRAGDVDSANALLEFIARLADQNWEDFHPGPAAEMVIGRINELSALARPPAMLLPLQRLGMASMPAPSETEFNAAMLSMALKPIKEWTGEDEEKLAKQAASGAITAAAARAAKPTHETARQFRGFMIALSETERAADSAADALSSGFDAAAALPLAIQLRAQIASRRAALQAMSDQLYTITETFERQASDSPSFGPITSQLKSMIAAADEVLELFPDPAAAAEAAEAEAGETSEAAAAPGAPGAVAAAPKRFSGETPQTRADVLVAIDAINRYYAANEPTSPVPLMLKRVRDWVEMDFFKLLKEIAPGGVDEAHKLLAIRDE